MQIQRGTICYVVHRVCAPDEKLKHWTRGVCFTRKREVRRRRIGRRSIYFLFAKKSVENWREQTKKQWVTIIPPPKSQDDEGREKGRSGQVFVRLIKGYPFIPNFAVLENFSAAKWGFIIAAGSTLPFSPSPAQQTRASNNLHLIFFLLLPRRSAARPPHPFGEVCGRRDDLGDLPRLRIPHSEHHLAKR